MDKDIASFSDGNTSYTSKKKKKKNTDKLNIFYLEKASNTFFSGFKSLFSNASK